ncbi:hypothetical protein AB0M20_33695 [Actinoplanes sp. NPDC051633]|uniref:hypothetical protein n=1 Tax=Actinoplanes sp. NPDC051633 TaxID=3155670 RepID=UPI00341D164B
MAHVKRWSWGLGIATATALTAFGVASWQADAAPNPTPRPGGQASVTDPRPGPEAAAGVGDDALTTDEVKRARTIALTPELVASAKDVTGKAGPQYLSAEIREDGTRTAEVYFYDYGKNKLIKQVVDLTAGKVSKSFAAQGLQMPASRQEVDAALDLLLADKAAADLKDAYQKATGKAFAGKDGLTVTAHVFTAKAADTGVKQCGKHRCLQLIVETPDGLFIDVHQIIVDLSGRAVARLS